MSDSKIFKAITDPATDVATKHINDAVENALNWDVVEECFVKDDTPVEPLEWLCEFNGRGVFARGAFALLKGTEKSGKSMLSTLLAGAALGIDIVDGIRAQRREGFKVLHVDTEQNSRNIKRMRTRIDKASHGKWAGVSANYYSLNVRKLQRSTGCAIRDILHPIVEHYKPDLLIIDGTKDLMKTRNINDQADAVGTAKFLSDIADEFNLWGIAVLHTNPSRKGETSDVEDKGRGAVGTEVEHEFSETWHVSRKQTDDDRTIYEAQCKASRDHAVGESWQIAWTLTEDGYFASSESKKAHDEARKFQEFRGVFVRAFGPDVTLTKKELEIRIISQGLKGWGDRSTRGKIAEAVERGIIAECTPAGSYKLVRRGLAE